MELNQVPEELVMDTLLTNDWAKLENLVKLLEHRAASEGQPVTLKSSLLNLEAHLLITTSTTTTTAAAAAGKQLARVLLKAL